MILDSQIYILKDVDEGLLTYILLITFLVTK